MRWLILEHALNQIFEVIRKEFVFSRLIFAVSLPEKISSISSQHFIEWVIFFVSLVERWMLSHKDEQNGGSSENIYGSSLILLSLQELWSHVSLGTERSLKISLTISALDRSSESKISDL